MTDVPGRCKFAWGSDGMCLNCGKPIRECSPDIPAAKPGRFRQGDQVDVYESNLGTIVTRGISEEELRRVFPASD